jgi:hypothetical protein
VGSVGRGGGAGLGTSRVPAGGVSWEGHPGVAGSGARRWRTSALGGSSRPRAAVVAAASM